MKKQTAEFHGSIRATASAENPLQTVLEFTLTDFQPNINKQQIPRSEAENIIRSALNMPIKIKFQDGKQQGHAGAYPIGTLSGVWLEQDCIMARAIVWRDEASAEDNHLRSLFDSGESIGTSWEIYYTDAEDQDGISVLQDCLFAATCIVEKPAYAERTRIKSLSEMDTMEESENTPNPDMVAMNAILDKFSSLYDVIWDIYCDVCEAQEAEKEAATIEDAAAMIEMLKNIQAKYSSASTALATAQETLTKIELEKAQAELDAKITARKQSLAQVGIDYTALETFFNELSDTQFESYLASVKTLKPATAETSTIAIPEPITGNKNPSIKDIADAIKELKKVKN